MITTVVDLTVNINYDYYGCTNYVPTSTRHSYQYYVRTTSVFNRGCTDEQVESSKSEVTIKFIKISSCQHHRLLIDEIVIH